MSEKKRFNSLPEAKRYVYACLHAILDRDLNSGVEGYLFDPDFSERDRERAERAARQVLNELYRRARPPRRGR